MRQEFDRVLNGLELDDRRLFHQLRLQSGSSSLPTSSITIDGQSYRDDIFKGWARYFETLATPVAPNGDTTLDMVERNVLSVPDQGPTNTAAIVVPIELVRAALESLI